MVDLLGYHRADNTNLVGDAGDVRKDLANLLLRLAPLAERMLRAQATQFLGSLKLCNRLAIGQRFGDGLAVHFRQGRLVIECLQMGRTTRHGKINDAPRAGRKRWRIGDTGPALGLLGGSLGRTQQLGVHQRSQRKSSDAPRRPAKELAAGQSQHVLKMRIHKEIRLLRRAGCHKIPWRLAPRFNLWAFLHFMVCIQYLTIVSCRFKMARATSVQAASSDTSSFSATGA